MADVSVKSSASEGLGLSPCGRSGRVIITIGAAIVTGVMYRERRQH
jgi:hypothetical protein